MSVRTAHQTSSARSSSPLVDLRHLTFSYRDDEILSDVTLTIQKGDFMGLIGPNGSGKTTLLRLLLGLLPVQTGEISLFGQSIANFCDWQKIGYVAQRADQSQFHVPITVEEVILLGRNSVVGIGRPFGHGDRQKVREVLEVVGLAGYGHRLITELSGGQQQRVFIARALVSDPELLILDEPTTGVDVESQEKFYELLADLNHHGLTLLIVSHDLDVVLNEVNKVACFNKTVVYHGNSREFVKGNYLEKLYGKSKKFVLHHH